MKILAINNFNYLRRGAETAFLDTIKELEKRGHQVARFSVAHPENEPSAWSEFFPRYHELGGSEQYGLGEKLKIVFKIFYNFEAKRKLAKLLDKFHPDVAHLHNVYHHLSPSILDELKKRDIPVMMTLHDFKIASPCYGLFDYRKHCVWEKSKQHKFYRALWDKTVQNSYLKSLVCVTEAYLHRWLGIYSKVDLFTAPSRFMISKMREFGVGGKIIKMINPLDIEESESGNISDTEKQRALPEKFVLFYGGLDEVKGADLLLLAYSKIKHDVPLIVAGDGPEKTKLENLAKRLGIENKVQFLGWMKHPELFALIRKSLFVVVPSKMYENAPYSVFETLGLGKAVIVPAHGGAKESVELSGAGLLFEPFNHDDLAKKIDSALNDLDEMKKLGEKGRKFILDNYNSETFYAQLMKSYRLAQEISKQRKLEQEKKFLKKWPRKKT